jgi:hypothetical protein
MEVKPTTGRNQIDQQKRRAIMVVKRKQMTSSSKVSSQKRRSEHRVNLAFAREEVGRADLSNKRQRMENPLGLRRLLSCSGV